MQLVNELDKYQKTDRPLYLVLGNFDGIHRGHQKLIKAAVEKAYANNGLATAFIFEPHPSNILKPSHAPRILTSIQRKAAILEELGMDILIINSFTPEISRWSPQEFVQKVLVNSLSIKEAFVGFNYSFGHKGQGTPEMLRELGKEHNFSVNIIPPVKVKGEIVSSTLIRRFLEVNDIDTAIELLGYPI